MAPSTYQATKKKPRMERDIGLSKGLVAASQKHIVETIVQGYAPRCNQETNSWYVSRACDGAAGARRAEAISGEFNSQHVSFRYHEVPEVGERKE